MFFLNCINFYIVMNYDTYRKIIPGVHPPPFRFTFFSTQKQTSDTVLTLQSNIYHETL